MLTMFPEVAVMFVVPVATPVAKPVLSMVAMLVREEAHLAELVMSIAPPPCTVATALNGTCCPTKILGLVGVTAIEITFASWMETDVDVLTVPEAAVMVVCPRPTPVKRPEVVIVAIVTSPVPHWTLLVKVLVLPSS